MSELPRVLVVQNGSRHDYAVPLVLERAGMLAAFYTDACGNLGIGRLLSAGRHLPLLGSRFRRLHGRWVGSQLAKRTISFPLACAVDQTVLNRLRGVPHGWTARQMIRRGHANAAMIYSSLGWCRGFLESARDNGVKVITEFYLRPSLWRTCRAEHHEFPAWETRLPWDGLENAIGTQRDPCTVSDYVIVPAEGVGEDVAREHRFPQERILVVPYGVGDTWFRVANLPQRGRILFAGTCCLAKGLHYYAMAADTLRRKRAGSVYEFRAAGDVTALVQQQSICRHVNFLGRIPRTAMLREFQFADVFVLPSLSEGSAAVTYEALAAGVPVVTTRASGSVVRDGIEGRIVPERDPDALAAAIAELVEDRAVRNRMAEAARERARQFTWDRYGERLVSALRQVGDPKCNHHR